jgi:hypothetical protein
MKTDVVGHPKFFGDKLLRQNITPIQLNLGNYKPNHTYLAVYDALKENLSPEQTRAVLFNHLKDNTLVDCILTQPPVDSYGFGTEDCYVLVQTWTVMADEASNVNVITLINIDVPKPPIPQ